ncbi:U-box domain-containing protein 28 [Selaginella moellendorffii]|nr:U-box domain-containing protein 28 [Selaginella moellendorffii]|eukprot:XP_002976432.2 U-box domain-containing protein 28 [Selaginella moellendorffii]
MRLPVKNAEIPPYFRCPISFELMEDPVILSSGITYERSSIQKWLLDGNRACPVTRQALGSCELIPNSTLKQLIKSWSSSSNEEAIISLEEVLCREIDTSSVAIAELLDSSFLLALSKLPSGDSIWERVGDHDEFLEALFATVLAERAIQEEDQAAALSILHTLCKLDAKFTRRAFAACFDSLKRFARLLTSSSKTVRTNAASLLETLLSSLSAHDHRQMRDIDGLDALIQGLVWLLAKNTTGDQASPLLKSLLVLLATQPTKLKLRAIECGSPKLLIDLLLEQQPTAVIKQQSLELLRTLCCCAEGREALAVDHARAVPAILGCVLKISTQATEHGTFIAWALIVCHHSVGSHAVEDSFLEAGGLSTMVMVLQCDCSMSTKHRAGGLLKHFSWLWKTP